MKARALTLVALAACWPAWLATGWLAQALSPGGVELLLRAGLLLALLGALGRQIDRLAAQGDPGHHG